MSITQRLGGALFALVLATPLVAQDRGIVQSRGVFFFARGGGFNGLSNLTDAGATADFKKVGFNKLDGMGGALTGIDKTQFDVAWSGGASYQLPF